ncbi:unnamed protein product [Rotaria magnacalcarata]|uniref:Uncharacterized protein n=5 Tax=Rotaria magnacalcarata TaxID=392030 RepID=A0A819PZ73_9BILA|nr:unnamed protein product [Rotaria magnacalcarata]CAF1365634.1 unnamed protein product [Rotaria magnacalcarata]CAF1963132.1 unnamed protein product [Rotaria magnacalcarata]CAF2134738.1 unnamed protein product [Rotaria magnacalcarata]CAF3969921.1 unnamed protein product [Rotaria magnacalcarata]
MRLPLWLTNRRRFLSLIYLCLLVSLIVFLIFHIIDHTCNLEQPSTDHYRRRPECKCDRNPLPTIDLKLISKIPKNQSDLCSDYATRRGPNQRIISISLYGPKENKRFANNSTMYFLHELINDVNKFFSDNFILRIHHDDAITYPDVICPIECRYSNVDFCNMTSKRYIPPKIWRFIPAGDPLVDTMMSRDLDSPLTERERAAIDEWLAANKSFHAMRDHPMHVTAMLGGMWGFRPSLDPTVSISFHNKIHNQGLVQKYPGINDQAFLTNEVWPQAKSSIIVHDSFICQASYGTGTQPFPIQRPLPDATNCYIGCVRPCCLDGKLPFGECPKACRPKNHQDWIYC